MRDRTRVFPASNLERITHGTPFDVHHVLQDLVEATGADLEREDDEKRRDSDRGFDRHDEDRTDDSEESEEDHDDHCVADVIPIQEASGELFRSLCGSTDRRAPFHRQGHTLVPMEAARTKDRRSLLRPLIRPLLVMAIICFVTGVGMWKVNFYGKDQQHDLDL